MWIFVVSGPFDAIHQESGVTSGVSQTQASSSDMAKAAAEFDRVNGEIDVMLRKLMGELEILNSSWRGLAGTKFTEVKLQYERDLTTINQALAATAESIRVSGLDYTATDTDAAARVTQSGGGGINLPL
jgi:WXG100 family type VII secretion target